MKLSAYLLSAVCAVSVFSYSGLAAHRIDSDQTGPASKSDQITKLRLEGNAAVYN